MELTQEIHKQSGQVSPGDLPGALYDGLGIVKDLGSLERNSTTLMFLNLTLVNGKKEYTLGAGLRVYGAQGS